MTRAEVHRTFTFDPETREPLEKLAREFADAVGEPGVAVVLMLGGLLDNNWREVNTLKPILVTSFYTAKQFASIPADMWTRIAGWNVVFFAVDAQVDYFLGKTLSCKDGKFFLAPRKPPPGRRTPVDMS
ncbi:hypothetical protein NK718_10785 [Alsobacter sp. SYSU M60028]|uniref:Uncharacterized protein n=1 Tax=Alsobacter ponti TaxID=2962936 RepID=A0ABT1LBX9_9HYPH|nr:hypothetical protein [Alsobacter ponti]MCP8939002.1 hypothetical protein [Alsobacter ponti]